MIGFEMRRAALGFLWALFAVVAANAVIVRNGDPLLFWSEKATREQPFFSTVEFGNFSRYVYAGLMRRLSYETLWLGPSFATPFGSTPDSQNELLVSMGNMTSQEMADLLRFETSLGKASTINLVVSPLHFTYYYLDSVPRTAKFPTAYYGDYGVIRYVLDPQMARLALGRVIGPRDKDFLSESTRVALNRRYFWMPDDQAKLQAHWKRYSMAAKLKQDLSTLRSNLPRVSSVTSAQKQKWVESRAVLQLLFTRIDAVPKGTRVNFVFPPAHLSYWAHPAPLVAEALALRDAIIEFASSREDVRIFDFEADWGNASDRSYYYDGGHFSDRNIGELREQVRTGNEQVGDMRGLFDKFLATGPEFDAAQIATLSSEGG
jgi:hypothetical protein